jgi:hypothetical protein
MVVLRWESTVTARRLFAPKNVPFPGSRMNGAVRFVGPAVSITALCFLSLVFGGMAVCHGFFPGRQLRNAYEGAKALKVQWEYDRADFSVDLWSSNRFGKASGVTRLDREKAFPGYTLYTSGHIQGAILIDMDGRVVHKWELPYDRIWEKTSAVRNPRPAHQIFWFKAHVFPNGDMLAVIEGNGTTPWGQGIIKIDRESRLIWKHIENAHHDFSIGDDGRIYCLTHRMRKDPTPGVNVAAPYLEDYLVVLSREGRKLSELSLLEAFRDSEFLTQFNEGLARSTFGEYMHPNSARVVTEAMAASHPFARSGQVCVSMPVLQSSLALVDIDKRRVVWWRLGSWRWQHDPDFLENGNILLFDNWGNTSPGGFSRVIEFNPANDEIVWFYAGSVKDPLESRKRSGQQRLPNGNTLITESDAGRMLEVTRGGNVVWEFINPARGGKRGEAIPVTSTGERIAVESLDPSFVRCLASRNRNDGGAP